MLYGAPGANMWHMQHIELTIHNLRLVESRMRLCHFDLKHDSSCGPPSGSHIKVVTNITNPQHRWPCTCSLKPTAHVLDWYVKTKEHTQWRNTVHRRLTEELMNYLDIELHVQSPVLTKVTDEVTSSWGRPQQGFGRTIVS